MSVSVDGLLIVVAAGFLAPFLLGLAPALRLPAIVLEIVFGILIGPVLGWVEVDQPIAVTALIGLAFLLFLAGLEIDVHRLRGRSLSAAGVAFAVSAVLAVVVGFGLAGAGLVDDGLFIAVILVTTGLGVIVPILKDAGETVTPFGQLVIAAGSIAEFGAIIFLTLLFSSEAGSIGSRALLLGGFVLVSAGIALAAAELARAPLLSTALQRLQDTTAQIRVRGAFLLVVAFVALAEGLGLEVVLGAFVAGALLSVLDPDRRMTHPEFRHKLEAAGFGVFIPVFFVTSGLRFDVDALLDTPSALAVAPVLLVAMLVVRGVPAWGYRSLVGAQRAVAAGLLQATTSVAFLVAATEIGRELDVISPATSAALVLAGLVATLLFPLVALTILRRQPEPALAPDGVGAPG